jgi:hypothetical protein
MANISSSDSGKSVLPAPNTMGVTVVVVLVVAPKGRCRGLHRGMAWTRFVDDRKIGTEILVKKFARFGAQIKLRLSVERS